MKVSRKVSITHQIKLATKEIFSNKIYSDLVMNRDISMNALLFDDKLQSKTFIEVISAMESFNPDSFILEHNLNEEETFWFNTKMSYFSDFKAKIKDMQGNMAASGYLDSKLEEFYAANSKAIDAWYKEHAAEEGNIKSKFLSKFTYDKILNKPFRIVNCLLSNEGLVAQQSFDYFKVNFFYS